MGKLVAVEDLRVHFHTEDGVVRAVDAVTFDIDHGEILGVVGESGCGKSVTALSIIRLLPRPAGRIASGRILFRGQDLLKKPEAEMRHIRGNDIAMIFQEPMTSLNPVYSCGAQVAEAIRLHQGLRPREAWAEAVDMLSRVGIAAPERRAREYPHQLSGGMRQRVMIAMALSCNPRLLIADEPTTALDVTVQAQILELVKELKRDMGMAVMLITHDLGVIAEMARRVVVMYAGRVVEEADVMGLFRRPLHPYTEGLLDAVPRIDLPRGRLHVIPGQVPDPGDLPPGCRFHPRCAHRQDVCRKATPKLVDLGEGRRLACWVRGQGREAP